MPRISTSGYLPGGDTYTFNELRDVPGRISTTLPTLDELTNGGLQSGGVWGLVGPRGIGVTALALQIAIDCARSGHQVTFVNDHVDAGALKARLQSMSGSADQDVIPTENLNFASWVPDPELIDGEAHLNLWRTNPRLVVLDTFRDAYLFPQARQDSPELNLKRLCLWRTWVRREGASVLVTLRGASPDLGSIPTGFAEPAYLAVVEVADTIVSMKSADPSSGYDEPRVAVEACRHGRTHRGFAVHMSPSTMRIGEVTRGLPVKA